MSCSSEPCDTHRTSPRSSASHATVARRARTTAGDHGAIVAATSPPERVRALCATHGWELVPDYPSLDTLLAGARVAVAPLTHTAGIQNKVLDAAIHGMPQVATPAALAGFDPAFPSRRSTTTTSSRPRSSVCSTIPGRPPLRRRGARARDRALHPGGLGAMGCARGAPVRANGRGLTTAGT